MFKIIIKLFDLSGKSGVSHHRVAKKPAEEPDAFNVCIVKTSPDSEEPVEVCCSRSYSNDSSMRLMTSFSRDFQNIDFYISHLLVLPLLIFELCLQKY